MVQQQNKPQRTEPSPIPRSRRQTTQRRQATPSQQTQQPRAKKRTVRYDRMIITALIFGLLIYLMVSCVSACSSDQGKTDTGADKNSSVITDQSGYVQSDPTDLSGSSATDAPSASSKSGSTTEISLKKSGIYEGDLIVVNLDHEYQFPNEEDKEADKEQIPENFLSIYSNKADCYQAKDWVSCLRSDVLNHLNDMMTAYYAATSNRDFMIINAYRGYAEQEGYYQNNTTQTPPGHSDYHTGMSFDIGIFPDGSDSYFYRNEGVYAWIQEHMTEYGFVLRYPEGSSAFTGLDDKAYQFRYVGVPHAYYMVQNNLCLEQYIDELRSYTYAGQTLQISCYDHNYEVYYVPADGEKTDLTVPTDYGYTISGNNIDGFIVTVTLS